MFIKILTKEFGGKKHYYASLVENKRIDGHVVQTVKAHLGPVTEEGDYFRDGYNLCDSNFRLQKTRSVNPASFSYSARP